MKLEKSSLLRFVSDYCGNDSTSKPERLTEIYPDNKEHNEKQGLSKTLSAKHDDCSI